MALAQWKEYREPRPEPVLPRRALIADHILMSLCIFGIAMLYAGLFAASHAAVDRTNGLREETAKVEKHIEQADAILAASGSSSALERWALRSGFQVESGPSVARQSKTRVLPSPMPKPDIPIDSYFARRPKTR